MIVLSLLCLPTKAEVQSHTALVILLRAATVNTSVIQIVHLVRSVKRIVYSGTRVDAVAEMTTAISITNGTAACFNNECCRFVGSACIPSDFGGDCCPASFCSPTTSQCTTCILMGGTPGILADGTCAA